MGEKPLDLFRWAVQTAITRTKADQGYVALLENDRFGIKYSEGDGKDRFLSLTIKEGIVGFVARSGEPHFCTDTGLDPHYVKSSDNVVHEIVVPLRGNGKVLGVLLVDSFDSDTFTRETVDELQEIASEFVNRFSKASERLHPTFSVELRNKCKGILGKALKLGFDQGYVGLGDEFGRLQIVYALGDEENRFLSLKVNEGNAGRSIRKKEPVEWRAGEDDDSDYVESSPRVVEEVAMPIMMDGEAVGVLLVDSFEAAVIDRRRISELQTLAQALASAILLLDPSEELYETILRAKLGRYFGVHDIDAIVAGEMDLNFKLREITVLFADIRNFSSTCARLVQRPELVGEFLFSYYIEMTNIIFNKGGALDKYIGDGVMAIFGFRGTKQKEAAASAVRAALEMEEVFESIKKAFAKNVEENLGISVEEEISFGCAVHSGEALVGFPESPLRSDLTVIGDTVNICAKLEDTFKDEGVRISGVTKGMLGSRFKTNKLGAAEIGSSHFPVYKVDGLRSRRWK